MDKTITITEKGQITLPVAARQALKLKSGDRLQLTLDPHSQSLRISKAPSIEELSSKLTSYIKSGTQPVLDVDDYYQKNRKDKL